MSIDWMTTLAAVNAASVAGGLVNVQQQVAAALNTAGTAYDNAGASDATAQAAYTAALAAWQTNSAAADAALAQIQAFAATAPGGAGGDPLRNWISTCQQVSSSYRGSSPVTPTTKPQPPLLAQNDYVVSTLQTALANANTFLAVVAF